MKSTFENKVVWIVGASSGIGKETAIQLEKLGAQLILSSRKVEQLEALKNQFTSPEKHLVLALDLEKSNNFNVLVEQVLERFGSIDYLFNNGGISQRSTASETSLEVLRKVFEIDFFGNVALTKAVLPVFQRQQSGHVVVISSIAGKFGFFLRSGYSAAKHALQGYYESLALEEEANGIHVTIACPGKINTPISISAITAEGKAHGVMDHNQATGMPVEECVSQLLQAVSKRKLEVFIGGRELLAVKIRRFFPGLFWRIIKKQSAT
ncbi:MAG: hypothetical protein RL264_2754 [Bacteroidota bacterium]|jgi:short-subunit dehydrogenase